MRTARAKGLGIPNGSAVASRVGAIALIPVLDDLRPAILVSVAGVDHH